MKHGCAWFYLAWPAKEEVTKNGQQKETADEGQGGLKEIVVGLDDEFAYLVDEEPNANPAQ
jgi:hypothetical protein